jgi:hypothetical protein
MKKELRKTVMWIELAQDRVQWQALVLAVLNLRVLLPENQLISEMVVKETGCEDGSFFLIIWFLRLLALRPLLAYCASLG